jgi:predicted transcriptional regulator
MKSTGKKVRSVSAPPPKDFVLSTLARNIRALCEVQGLSQIALAEQIHMSRAHLNQIEHAKEDPRLSTVARIATGLGVCVLRRVK